MQIVVVGHYRITHIAAQCGNTGITEGGNRMEDSEEDVILRSGSRQHSSDIHIYKVGPDSFDKESNEQNIQDNAEQPTDTVFVQHIFQNQFAGERRMPHERKGKETGKSHYSDSADLYQDHNDNVPDMCKSSRYVNRSQSRYTDRGRCREQRIDKMNRAGCRVRQHQQSGSDQDHKYETQQEQQ